MIGIVRHLGQTAPATSTAPALTPAVYGNRLSRLAKLEARLRAEHRILALLVGAGGVPAQLLVHYNVAAAEWGAKVSSLFAAANLAAPGKIPAPLFLPGFEITAPTQAGTIVDSSGVLVLYAPPPATSPEAGPPPLTAGTTGLSDWTDALLVGGIGVVIIAGGVFALPAAALVTGVGGLSAAEIIHVFDKPEELSEETTLKDAENKSDLIDLAGKAFTDMRIDGVPVKTAWEEVEKKLPDLLKAGNTPQQPRPWGFFTWLGVSVAILAAGAAVTGGVILYRRHKAAREEGVSIPELRGPRYRRRSR